MYFNLLTYPMGTFPINKGIWCNVFLLVNVCHGYISKKTKTCIVYHVMYALRT